MAKNDKARLDCRALPYLEPVARPPSVEDVGAALLSSSSRSPVRALLEARSDLSFIEDVVTTLATSVSADSPVEMARSLAFAVLASPTVAARWTPPESAQRVLQSVVVSGHPDDFDAQVSLQLLSVPGKPGTFKVETAAMSYVDLSDVGDQGALVAQVEQWRADYPMPQLIAPQPLPLRDWAWLGDPTHLGILEVPADWKDQVQRLGAAYGVEPILVETAEQMESWNVLERVEHLVVVRGSKAASALPSEGSDGAWEVSEWGYGGETFASMIGQVRGHLLAEAVAANRPPEASRSLEGGEVVYHRKVGKSQKFDRFDAGSSEPCVHGAGAFKGWGGDKAIKGMGRRYYNFTPAMLIHCNRYPNCGMYGVDASRGGVKRIEE